MQNSKENNGKKPKPKNDYSAPFATKLREVTGYDEKKGKPTKITQSQLADAIGVTRQTVSDYLLGNTQPNAEVITKIAQYFNVSSDYLLGLTNVPTPLRTDEQKALRMAADFTGLKEDTLKQIRKDFEERKHIDEMFKIAFGDDSKEDLEVFSVNPDTLLNGLINLYYKSLRDRLSEYLKSAEDLKSGIKTYQKYSEQIKKQAQMLANNVLNSNDKEKQLAQKKFEEYLGNYPDNVFEYKEEFIKKPLTATNSYLFLLQDAITTFAKEQFDATESINKGLKLQEDISIYSEIELIKKKVNNNEQKES